MKSHYSINRVKCALAHAERIMANPDRVNKARACRLKIDCLKWLGRWGSVSW